MYTQITYQDLVEKTLSRLGDALGIVFESPSTAEMHNYPAGKWLYKIDSHMTVTVSRWSHGSEKEVRRFRHNEQREEFEKRLDSELQSAILHLHNIDAQKLWQLINLYRSGGYLLEMRSDGTAADGETPYSETVFWPIGSDGEHVGSWWPSPAEVAVLVDLDILEPCRWVDTERSRGGKRKYTLTDVGSDIAAMNEDSALAYLAERGYTEHEQGNISWGQR